jgi:hypothetical protein
MELTRLAAKQKRHKDLSLFAEQEVRELRLRKAFGELLGRYQDAIAHCWRAQALRPEDLTGLDSIERDLDALCNEARLRTASY